MAPSTIDPADNGTRETATWTRYLPETLGIRETVRQSPYRWCTRERYSTGRFVCVSVFGCGVSLTYAFALGVV